MKELFFCIDQEHVDAGEFLPGEIGHWAVRGLPGGVLVFNNRYLAELVWAGIAPHHGYAHN
jgi:hypothetical protein